VSIAFEFCTYIGGEEAFGSYQTLVTQLNWEQTFRSQNVWVPVYGPNSQLPEAVLDSRDLKAQFLFISFRPRALLLYTVISSFFSSQHTTFLFPAACR
jgi:hypothetical protein